MEPSVMSTIGSELVSVISPVSLCTFLVVFLISTTIPSTPSTAVTAANLVYQESPSDDLSHKLQGALLNTLVFLALLAFLTFLLVLLYYLRCTRFLKHYTRFSAFLVLITLGGPILLTIVDKFEIPVDLVTCFLLGWNFSVLGVLSVFSGGGVPIVVRQGFMVFLAVIVAVWFARLPEWSTWFLLVGLAVYDLIVVLSPGGPLKLLVELASRRNEELPALVYEARPTGGDRGRSSLGILVSGVRESGSGSVELQNVSRDSVDRNVGNLGDSGAAVSGILNEDEHRPNLGDSGADVGGFVTEDESRRNVDGNGVDVRSLVNEDENRRNLGLAEVETCPLVRGATDRRSSSMGSPEIPTMVGMPNERRQIVNRESEIVEALDPESNRNGTTDDGSDREEMMSGGVKLGLGDFVFYSVLVGRAAMYDVMTVFACYLAIISGLGCTLIILAVYRRAMPALPISITLGVIFYLLTRLLLEPFVVGIATNLLMF